MEEVLAGSVPEAGSDHLRDPSRSADVVFVVMPFADVDRPAIGVSLLQAAAQEAGRSSVVDYCTR